MLIFGNFDRLAVESEQVADPDDVVLCQTGVGIEGKGVFLGKTDNTATGV